ncbi:MAG: histidinol-phosphate transaminase [Promethearchaeota archaeon]
MIKKIARRALDTLEPYEIEISNLDVVKQFAHGLKPTDVLRFDLNTNPYMPTPILEPLSQKITKLDVNEYPDATYISVRKGLTKYLTRFGAKVDAENIMITNGADEALDHIVKCFIDEHATSILPQPTYAMFKVLTEIMGGKTLAVPRKEDFSIDVDLVKRNISPETKLLFVCSPNNPTGNATPKRDIEELLNEEIVVMVDEAYGEFAKESGEESALVLLRDYDNLIVVKTFSKAFGMAGVRVGYIITNAEIMSHLNKIRFPNSVGTIPVEIADIALENVDWMSSVIKLLVSERKRVAKELSVFPEFRIFPSSTNFLLIEVSSDWSAESIMLELMKHGLVIRSYQNPYMKNHLRITIRSPEQNNKLLDNLKALMQKF